MRFNHTLSLSGLSEERKNPGYRVDVTGRICEAKPSLMFATRQTPLHARARACLRSKTLDVLLIGQLSSGPGSEQLCKAMANRSGVRLEHAESGVYEKHIMSEELESAL